MKIPVKTSHLLLTIPIMSLTIYSTILHVSVTKLPIITAALSLV
ncbi:hypothetical protein P9578_30625 [Brevibacillus choshinensis]|nr:hypothetical protein [Brevibacillus choshinensis]